MIRDFFVLTFRILGVGPVAGLTTIALAAIVVGAIVSAEGCQCVEFGKASGHRVKYAAGECLVEMSDGTWWPKGSIRVTSGEAKR